MSNETKILNGLQVIDSSGVIRESIDANGFKQLRYRDEYVAGEWVPAAASAAPDLTNHTISGLGTRLYNFDGGSTEERLSNSFEIPHDIDLAAINAETAFIEVHAHIMPSDNNTGDVELFFDSVYLPLGAAPEASTTLSNVATIGANEQYFHKIVAFLNGSALARFPKPAAGFSIGDIIQFNFRRSPGGTNDTYEHDIVFIKVALHVPVNDTGSRQLYVK